jgi:hypothetical protein
VAQSHIRSAAVQKQYATSPREARLHSPWKRSACDRCRSHKVKCERENNDMTVACTRCTRAGGVCFTSSAKVQRHPPPFQAAAAFPSSPIQEMHIADDAQCRRYTRGTATTPQYNLSRVLSQDSTFLMSWPFSAPRDGHGTALDCDLDVDLPSSIHETQPIDYSDLPVDENEPALSHDHEFPFSSTASSLTPPSFTNEMIIKDVSPLHPHQSYEALTNTSPSAYKDDPDSGVMLAELQQHLSKQLVALESTPWDLTTFSITSPVTAATRNQENLHQDGSFSPVASILASISQFVTILHRMKEPLPRAPSAARRRHHQHHHDDGHIEIRWPAPAASRLSHRDSLMSKQPSQPLIDTPQSARKAQSRVHLLATINCYLLVLTILDGIFSRVLSESQETSHNSHAASPPQMPTPYALPHNPARPELVFAGQPVTLDSRLRTRLLVQVIEHQLEALESSLGLPQSYCVSSSRTGSPENQPLNNGILSSSESLTSLWAAMGFVADAEESMILHHREKRPNSPMILSPGDKVKRVLHAQTKHYY